LAAPTSSGEALQLPGGVGAWGVLEQQIYRAPNSDDHGIGIFGRISGAPADRNLIDLHADTGVDFIWLCDKRPDDKFGIAAGYAHISKRAQQLDADYRTVVSASWPQRSFECLLTAVYQYQIRAGWTVQPNSNGARKGFRFGTFHPVLTFVSGNRKALWRLPLMLATCHDGAALCGTEPL
jgi:porin